MSPVAIYLLCSLIFMSSVIEIKLNNMCTLFSCIDHLNPDDISANLYSAGLLSKLERDEVNKIMQAIHTRVTTLLSAVERVILIDPKNFSTFLDILDQTHKYRPITSQARGEWLFILKGCVYN